MNIAVIPARGGSRRISRKNVRLFAGKPIIAYSIEQALRSGVFESVIVSTDDDEIAAIAEQYGATVPFRRPGSLADDVSGTAPVIAHATELALENNPAITAVCCVYATAPFVSADDIVTGL